MAAYAFILIGSFALLTGSALLALRWALRTGQFRHTERDALLIFDEEEPLGQVSDRYSDRGADHSGLWPRGPRARR